jgi:hypothetical protein
MNNSNLTIDLFAKFLVSIGYIHQTADGWRLVRGKLDSLTGATSNTFDMDRTWNTDVEAASYVVSVLPQIQGARTQAA